MTVRELIEKLNNVPQEMEVKIYGWNGDCCDPCSENEEITEVNIVWDTFVQISSL